MYRFRYIKFAALFAVFAALASLALMLLWNWLVPALFGGPEIVFWQSLGLLALSRILFGGFGKKHWGHHCHGNCHHGGWKARWERKMAGMSEQERQEWKSKMSKCGPWFMENQPETLRDTADKNQQEI